MKQVRFVLACMLTALAPVLYIGCEASSSEDLQLDLTPVSISLRPGQSQLFKVSGGFDYRWNLRNESIGTLNSRTGDEVIYTATRTNAEAQILTVRSFIRGATGNSSTNGVSTNVVALAASASATINQSGGTTTPTTPVTSFSITPSSAILTLASPSVTFIVPEGVSVNWAVQNGALGNPDNGSGNSFTYTAASFPTSAVTQVIEATYTPAGGSTVTKSVSVTQRAL
jgi:hypothetical protein